MFESEFAKTEYIEKDNVVFHVWRKEAHFDNYRNPVIASLEMLREHKNSIFIVDARNGFEDVKEDVEWGFSFFLPELKKTGCTVWGFILPEVSDIEGEIDLWTKEIEKNFRVIRAESYEDILKQVNDYKIRYNELNAEEFCLLWESVWGQPPTLEQTRLAMENTLFRISVFDEDKIIAMARVIGDKGLCYYIKDVIVRPEYQGKGLGRILINELLKYIDENGVKDTNIAVELCAMPDKIPFYEKFGFHSNEAQRLRIMYHVN